MRFLCAASLSALAVASGCVVDVPGIFDPGEPDGDEPPPGEETPAPPESWFGVMDSPRHGHVEEQPTDSARLRFHGYYQEPGAEIAIQVLSNPYDLASWTTLATAVTAEQPAPGSESDPVYEWEVEAQPAAGAPDRWPAGGVLRVRAVDPEGFALVALGHDADECLAESAGVPWRGLVELCGLELASGAVIVSPAPSPSAAADRPLFLDRKGAVTPDETLEYYAAMDAPATVADFKQRYGIGGPGTVSATYFNHGDLGIGREMHCARFAAEGSTGLSCLVANYGEFGGSEAVAIEETVAGAESGAHLGSFASVAMVYSPPVTAPNAVQFLVYGPDGGALVSEAPLDTREDNVSIPNNCLNCHGSNAVYDPAGNQVIGARFLPFDTAAFSYADRPGFRLADQQEAFRLLNQMVAEAGASAGVRELVDGMYGGSVVTVGVPQDTEFVPPGWTLGAEASATYRHAVARFCRSCHVSRGLGDQRDALEFTNGELFRAGAGAIGPSVCGDGVSASSHGMPNAEVTFEAFWASPARAYLVSYLGLAGPCSPP